MVLGGMKVQAKTDAAVKDLISQAREIEKAGCFALVLECVPSPGRAQSDRSSQNSHDRIGAGAGVSGQVLVYQDVLGLNPGFRPKFLENLRERVRALHEALNAFNRDVKDGEFPSDSESYA